MKKWDKCTVCSEPFVTCSCTPSIIKQRVQTLEYYLVQHTFALEKLKKEAELQKILIHELVEELKKSMEPIPDPIQKIFPEKPVSIPEPENIQPIKKEPEKKPHWNWLGSKE